MKGLQKPVGTSITLEEEYFHVDLYETGYTNYKE